MSNAGRATAGRPDAALAGHAEAWETLGRVDPLFAVLTDPAKRGRRWAVPEFLATGQGEVAGLLEIAQRLGRPQAYNSALDFGCGVGRLTLPLADRFDSVTGVDISETMLAEARRHASGRSNVRFEASRRDGGLHLPAGPFDLVVSLYVLQHLPSEALVVRHLSELARRVGPGGLLAVQLPEPIPLRNRVQVRRRAFAGLRRLGLDEDTLYNRLRLSPMRLIGLRQSTVRTVLARAGLEVLEVQAALLSRSPIDSFTYFATPGRGR